MSDQNTSVNEALNAQINLCKTINDNLETIKNAISSHKVNRLLSIAITDLEKSKWAIQEAEVQVQILQVTPGAQV